VQRELRREENQRMFRDANERLQETLDGQVPFGTVIPFLCECADDECRGRIEMNGSDYDAIHIDRDLYIIIPGHPRSAGEEVVGENHSYDIVRKHAA
jgi:hypothetical protein